MNMNLSTEMGKKLKMLRESKGLSHDKLKSELNKEYGITLSRESLMNYEVTNEDHPKVGSNNGMRIETLRYLADFYGVSTDWLLGLDDSENVVPKRNGTMLPWKVVVQEKHEKTVIVWAEGPRGVRSYVEDAVRKGIIKFEDNEHEIITETYGLADPSAFEYADQYVYGCYEPCLCMQDA